MSDTRVPEPVCPKCGGEMYEGHLGDYTGGGFVGVWKSGYLKVG